MIQEKALESIMGLKIALSHWRSSVDREYGLNGYPISRIIGASFITINGFLL